MKKKRVNLEIRKITESCNRRQQGVQPTDNRIQVEILCRKQESEKEKRKKRENLLG